MINGKIIDIDVNRQWSKKKRIVFLEFEEVLAGYPRIGKGLTESDIWSEFFGYDCTKIEGTIDEINNLLIIRHGNETMFHILPHEYVSFIEQQPINKNRNMVAYIFLKDKLNTMGKE